MTCSRVLYGLTATVLGYVTAAVAAFVYLPWWQAGLLLAALQVVLVLLARFLVRRTAARLLERLRNLSPAPPDPLIAAEADVHAVRRSANGLDRRYEVELTLFPAGSAAAAGEPWSLTSLCVSAGDGDKTLSRLSLSAVRVLANGDWRQAVGPQAGPQRLRFTLVVPSGAKVLTLCRLTASGWAGFADLPFGQTALPPAVGS